MNINEYKLEEPARWRKLKGLHYGGFVYFGYYGLGLTKKARNQYRKAGYKAFKELAPDLADLLEDILLHGGLFVSWQNLRTIPITDEDITAIKTAIEKLEKPEEAKAS